MTIPECAEYLGIGRSTAYELARTGRLPVLKLGRRLLIPKTALERMLEGRQPEGGDSEDRPARPDRTGNGRDRA